MKLKADFINDWIAHLRYTLSNWGYATADISDEKIPEIYFNVELRRLAGNPRSVVVTDTFLCPSELTKGWGILKAKIGDGSDLLPHLSKRVETRDEVDPLLYEWGVHHFHLGENDEGRFIERSDPLLFALVTKESFYAIGFFEHGKWANRNIVEIIHKHWPALIEKYKFGDACGLTNGISEEARSDLRKNKINSLFECSDGTIYAPMRGGVTTSKYNVQNNLQIIQQRKYLISLQNHLGPELDHIRPDLEQLGYTGEEEVEARLHITQDGYVALLPKYNLSVVLRRK